MASSSSPPTGEHDDNYCPPTGSRNIRTVENSSPRAFRNSHCIFKIPEFLTRNKQNSYDYYPIIVSIGPYHLARPELKKIQERKIRFENFFVSQANINNVSRDDLVRAVALREQDIRDSYSEELGGIKSAELIEMMVLDGCFLLTLFLTFPISEINDKFNFFHVDPIFNFPWVMSSIQRDLLVLENQLPFFVLQTLLETARLSSRISLTTVAVKFFSYSFERPRQRRAVPNSLEAKHLLDLIRNTIIPISRQTTVSDIESGLGDPLAPNDSLKLILSAKKLRNSGIKFKLKENMVDRFLDISLDNGKLQIPEIILDDFISLLILNGIAFEQFCADIPNHVTSYAMLMGCLINNGRDAAFLEEEGIIQNYYGTEDEVSLFFKRITKDYAFDIRSSYLRPVFVGVNEYTANGFHVHWAGFKYTYCGSPWIFLSSLAAVVLLVLTIFQVIYAAGFLHPI